MERAGASHNTDSLAAETASSGLPPEAGSAEVIVRELDENGSYIKHRLSSADAAPDYRSRRIKSFVVREGRLTAGQEHALTSFWKDYGIDYENRLLDLPAVFGRKAPLALEIGFGMGKSLVEMAARDPGRDFIGIEVHTPGVGACIMGAHEAGLTNLRVIHYDAVDVLGNMIPDGAIDRLQLYFPDPWHKARHNKRRLVKPEFLDLVIPKLASGGVIHMATDWEPYAEQMLEVQRADARIVNMDPAGGYAPRPDYRPLTKFEARGQRLGHGVWDLLFRKI